MTRKQAEQLAAKALPCPFCGEKLVAKEDHHGHWVAHKEEPGPCFQSAAQLFSGQDLELWNRRIKVEAKPTNDFWFRLSLALSPSTLPDKVLSVPLAVRTDRAADIGWGNGCTLLILEDGRISHPGRGFIPLPKTDEEIAEFADSLRKVFRLTKRERQVLNAIREGQHTYRHRCSKMVTVGDLVVYEDTISRLCLLGLVREVSQDNDSRYIAVQPVSVHKRNRNNE